MQQSSRPPSRPHGERPVPGGEFPFTWDEFRKIAALVHAEAGIVLNESKANLVYSRLAKRLRAVGLQSFRDYCELIAGENGGDERQQLVAAMTTNITSYFREPHHFAYLQRTVLPALIERAKAGRPVRIWSAGCSSGEEAMSIATTLVETFPEVGRHDVLILATDIDPNMVAKGKQAVFTARQLGAALTAPRKRFFKPASPGSDSYVAAPVLTDLVRFKELNLLGPWPMRGQFDVIFCRNTMIYFDLPTQETLWKRFSAQMASAAHLFIGHSERVPPSISNFDLVAQTVYRRKEAR